MVNTTTGLYNTATGAQTLFNNTTGYSNTASGLQALFGNTTGHENTAIGVSALVSNTSGDQNTASGVSALQKNTTGFGNTASGALALQNNTDGLYNTASGTAALQINTTGDSNTAGGAYALGNNTTGFSNTAAGLEALFSNTTGTYNTALGTLAGFNLTTGSYNINIGLAVSGPAGEANTTRIGNSNQTRTFVSGIYGVTATSGVAVYVNSNGQLGTATSSARFKEDIKPMKDASEAILGLTPVMFRYKHELDPDGVPQFGLVAEEVEKVNPDLVAKDAEGKVYTVRYEAVNAMLLNEFLKAHKKAQDQERKLQDQEATITQLQTMVAKQNATIAQQQKGMEVLTSSLKEQAVQIQKVSARVEANGPGTRTADNDR
jgi:uncharacterized coiled-coil protein SlyX